MIFYSSAREAAPSLQAVSLPAASSGRIDTPNATRPDADAPGQGAASASADNAPQAGTSPINVTIVNGENASANYTTLDVSGLTGDQGAAVVAAPLGLNPAETQKSGDTAATVKANAAENAVASAAPRMETNKAAPSKASTASTAATPPKAAGTATTVAKASSANSVKPAVTVTEYWIQTGSFNGKLNAEKARETLKARYLNTEIFTKEVSGATVYRVRVGPYAKKTEADYWLGVVKDIQGFADSYVSEVKTKR